MPASSFATCDACGTFVPDDTRGPVTVGATPVRNVMGLPANLCPACRERWQGATLKDPSPPDVALACARFEELGVRFKKRPQDGAMKDIAFIMDPDGYWIEILSANGMRAAL